MLPDLLKSIICILIEMVRGNDHGKAWSTATTTNIMSKKLYIEEKLPEKTSRECELLPNC
ncbi:hypothetical protein C7121_24910 [Paenibacillus glucanolyticus]|jgi:hypothetical protein|nr:hypothetical protein A3958_20120 [Paenibacillus glucanolyticus]AVV59126.1 hypothetical protein C7121_24910 [Paenibacillus glucanolyticus]